MSDQSLDKSKCIDGSYGWVVVLFTMLVGFVPGSNMAKAISLAPIVCMNFQINEATFGLIVASFYIMGFIMAFPTTGLVNKLGMKGSVAIAVGCGIIGSIMGAMAGTNLTVFVVSRVIEGASFGIMGVVGASSIGPWFSPKKRSLPLSIWSMWVAVCMCVCPILFGWLNESMGVDMAGIWWGTAVYDLVVGILFILFYRRPLDLDKVENEEDPTGTKKASISRALKSPMLWALALIFLFDEAAFMAINGFIVQYLTTQLDASLVLANAIFSLFGLMGALTPPFPAGLPRSGITIAGSCSSACSSRSSTPPWSSSLKTRCSTIRCPSLPVSSAAPCPPSCGSSRPTRSRMPISPRLTPSWRSRRTSA